MRSYSKTMPMSGVCGAIACAIMLVIVAISVPECKRCPFSKYDKFNRQSVASISRIEFILQHFPHLIITWKVGQSCDCGRHYSEIFSPCIKIYSNISDSIFLDDALKSQQHALSIIQLFGDGEDIRMIETYLNESKHIYDTYINSTIDCYYDDPLTQIYG